MSEKPYSSQTMLEKLIGFDTTSHLSNLDFMHFVQDYLLNYGITSDLIHNTEGNKANLHACVGDVETPGIILSGHTDVVPVEGQDWSFDPFELTEKNGKLYGRGTSDMKSFIAVVLAKIPEISAHSLSKPIHLAFSYDEEVGCTGVVSMVDKISNDLPVRPEMCIVGEPTSMRVINGHKAVNHIDCEITGHECHSSLAPYGVNAVEYGADLVTHVRKISRRLQAEGPFNTDYDPPFTTLHVGVFNGGTAVNIVPNKTKLDIEMRSVPEQDVDAVINEIRDYAYKILEPEMKAKNPKTGFEFDMSVGTPALSTPEDAEVVTLTKNITGENATHKVSFATEAGLFQNGGIPTVVCGPGNIEQAHKPDEFIEVEQIVKCERFIDGLVKTLAT